MVRIGFFFFFFGIGKDIYSKPGPSVHHPSPPQKLQGRDYGWGSDSTKEHESAQSEPTQQWAWAKQLECPYSIHMRACPEIKQQI